MVVVASVVAMAVVVMVVVMVVVERGDTVVCVCRPLLASRPCTSVCRVYLSVSPDRKRE